MNTIPVRQIDQTPPPDRYARGWHCLGLSASFKDKPKAIMAFGTRIVVFRNSGWQRSLELVWFLAVESSDKKTT